MHLIDISVELTDKCSVQLYTVDALSQSDTALNFHFGENYHLLGKLDRIRAVVRLDVTLT